MRTAIFTARNDTKLTIEVEADEVVDLVQMGGEGPPIRLGKGIHPVVVSAGLWKVVSRRGSVRVTPDAPDVKVAITPQDKIPFPDLTGAQTMAQALNSDSATVMAFLADAKSGPDVK